MLKLSAPRLCLTLLAIPLVSLAACEWNEVETGKHGQIELTPDDCGKLFCDLDDGIAVGGSLDVSLRGKEGRSASGLRLVSSAPWIVDVLSLESDGLEPRFRIAGTGGGRADLIVVDGHGYEVDYLPVEVATIGDLAIDAHAVDLVEVTAVGVDEAFQAPVGSELTIDVAGMALGRELTGEVSYRVSLDAALAASTLSGSDAGRGHLVLRVPAGDHELVVTAPGGAQRRILIMGR